MNRFGTTSLIWATLALATFSTTFAAGNDYPTDNTAGGRTRGTEGASGLNPSNTMATGMDWSAEDNYWRRNYRNRPYYSSGMDYTSYQPAYRYGVELYNRHNGRSFDELDQSELKSEWDRARGNSTFSWDEAQQAVRDSYNRMRENRASSGSGTGTTGTMGTTGTSSSGSSTPSSGASSGGMNGTTGSY